MSTVLVDRYDFWCEECGYRDELMIGANRGVWDVTQEVIDIHRMHRPGCQGGSHTIRVKLKTKAPR